MEDKYAILKKLAHQKAKDEVGQLFNQDPASVEGKLVELKLKNFEQEIFIEELKHDKSKVEKLSAKYSDILKKLSTGYIICDQHGSIEDMNTKAASILSIPPLEKSYGRPLSLSICFDYRTKFLQWLSAVTVNGSDDALILKGMNENILSFNASKLNDTEIILTIEDISKAQKELEMLHLIKKAFDETRESIIITDENVKIIYANRAFSDTTGYQKHEVVGRNPSMLKSGIYGSDFYEKMWSSINSNGFWRGEIADKKKDGSLSIHRSDITAIKQGGKVINYIAIFSDITKEHTMNERILELSVYDALTRLPNRNMFINKIEEMCASRFTGEEGFSLMFVDLDNFKFVNDTFGHSFGDELLIEVSRRLKNMLRKSDLVARLGGDEFVIILEGTTATTTLQIVADNIVKTVSSDIKLSIGESVNVGCSIGISVYPLDARNYEDLIKYADMAMYKAKEGGKNQYCFYNEKMSEQSVRLSKIKTVLKNAEKYGEVYLKYQLQYCAKTLKPYGVEALARWNNVQYGEVSPLEFITIAEQNGYIKELGSWIYSEALREMANSDFFRKNLKEIAINISGSQIKEKNFVNDIITMTKNSGLDTKNIVLEVTETMLVENLSLAGDKLETLRGEGFKVALDDFGTGFSSLSYLQKLPIDIVKIDKSFVDNIVADKKSRDIVGAVIELAHCLDKSTVAEGVESKEQAELLAEAGCDLLQGYYFSKPIKPRYFEHLQKEDI